MTYNQEVNTLRNGQDIADLNNNVDLLEFLSGPNKFDDFDCDAILNTQSSSYYNAEEQNAT